MTMSTYETDRFHNVNRFAHGTYYNLYDKATHTPHTNTVHIDTHNHAHFSKYTMPVSRGHKYAETRN